MVHYLGMASPADGGRGLQHLGDLLCHHLVYRACWMQAISPEIFHQPDAALCVEQILVWNGPVVRVSFDGRQKTNDNRNCISLTIWYRTCRMCPSDS